MDKSRRERRKEARLVRNTRKHEVWLQHQKDRRHEKKVNNSNSKDVKELNNSSDQNVKSIKNQSLGKSNSIKGLEAELESSEHNDSISSKMVKRKKITKRNAKTGFEKFLEMDINNTVISAEEDLELERKLAKKLKVKNGKVRDEDLGMNMFFKGIPSALDSLEEEKLMDTEEFPVENFEKKLSSKMLKKEKLSKQGLESEIPGDSTVAVREPLQTYAEVESEDVSAKLSSGKKNKKTKLLDKGEEGNTAVGTGVDVPKPVESDGVAVASKAVLDSAPGKYIVPHLRSLTQNESEEYTQFRTRIKRLLNRLIESNVESSTGEVSIIFRLIARGIASQILSEEVLAFCSKGPRGNEQYAAVFAAFVAGMACSVGVDFGAKLMANLAKTFEDEYHKKDNLSLRNLTLLLSYLYIFGVCSSDLIYDFLTMLSKRLSEIDVSTIVTVLECCGMKIRADDPLAMKDFVQSVQNRASELKASSGEGKADINSFRMEFMLETIYDIKNNKKRPKEDPHAQIKKWLQKLGADKILVRGLMWSKLLDPDKKGQWWLSGDMASTRENVADVAGIIDKEVLEAQTMLQLAASQGMNTEARKAIFCIIMSGEDYIDAFEKLLRLDLHGKQDREIMRVLVECCLQEKVFNKYYTVLASKLCEHDKNHKFTLQFCIWDHLKEIESMQLIRSMHLAKFVAEIVSSFTLSLAVLKAVDLSDISQLTPKRIMHFRMLFEAIFEQNNSLVWNIFTRIAVAPDLESLRRGIEFFIKEYLVKTNRAANEKFKVLKKALNNNEGILL